MESKSTNNTETENNNPISSGNSQPKRKLRTENKSVLKKKEDKKIPKNETLTEKFLENIFSELITKKNYLEKEINILEDKKLNIEKDIEKSFSGQSENILNKVKGFQEYLSGSLQNLSLTVDKLNLVSQPIIVKPSPLDEVKKESKENELQRIPALSDTFKPDEQIIRKCLSNFTDQPDFYAEPWKLRRSLENIDLDMLEDWFFNMGGRGALESRGSRPKNILIAAGLISILGELYGDQFQTLILASEPERLGEWRRILQDSLGLTREDFGPNSGIVLFERSEGVIERADRLEANDELPLIIIDASETSIEVPILQFPLWLAFAGTPEEIFDDLDLE